MSPFSSLPKNCLVRIFSLTSPKDLCTMAVVSKRFKLIADSDAVWELFLPPGYEERISDSDSPVVFSTMKQLYFLLCNSGLLLDGGRLHLSFSKSSGKKCYLICARELYIAWGATPHYWSWTNMSESRFCEVAVLKRVCWFDVCGIFPTELLSPNTNYASYLVYKLEDDFGFYTPIKVSVKCVGGRTNEAKENTVRTACLGQSTSTRMLQQHKEGVVKAHNRTDGWTEIELGEFFLDEGHRYFIENRAFEIEYGSWKRGLIIEGIEIRPKGTGQGPLILL